MTYKVDDEFIDFALLNEFIFYIRNQMMINLENNNNEIIINKDEFPEILHHTTLQTIEKQLNAMVQFRGKSRFTNIVF